MGRSVSTARRPRGRRLTEAERRSAERRKRLTAPVDQWSVEYARAMGIRDR
jgi:hypothetical protein